MLTEVEGFFEVRKDYGNGVIERRGTVRSVLGIRKETLEFKKLGIFLKGKQRTKSTRVGSGDAQDAALLKDDLKGPRSEETEFTAIQLCLPRHAW
ncbi:hypothetical protein PSHT_06170 [Puccinia striiformis]|uniref:Uncharacterized protein n=1 Tax=Puccinia striiformis TaxID=27350 RepID=A0A2S4W8L0_9BASI|nr:hypothetical protein PSHT_06170 [Puccinia striiformis]